MPRATRLVVPVLILALLSGMTAQIWTLGVDRYAKASTPAPAATPGTPTAFATPGTPTAFATPGTPDSLATPLVSDVSAVVNKDGFTVDLDGVTVSAPSGVAPTGVGVRARFVEQPLPDELSGFAEAVGPAVDITLGDNLQPAVPLTITLATEAVSGLSTSGNSGDQYLPMVISSKDEAPGWEFADAQLLADGSMVVTASHLSRFQFSFVSVRGFADWLANQVLVFLQVRSDKPDCAKRDTTGIGWEVSPIPGQVMWPCLDKSGHGLEISFTNNSPEVWILQSRQAPSGVSTTLSASGMLVAAIGQVSMDSTRSPLVAPDGRVSYRSSGDESKIVFDARLSDGLTKLNALLQVLLGFIPGKMVEAVGHAQCFADIVSVVLEDADESPGGMFATILGCFADAVGVLAKGVTGFEATRITLVGALISAVAALPGALWAGTEAAFREFSGNDHFTITLSKIDSQRTPTAPPTAAVADASGWPTGRNDSAPGLYTWIGASSAWPGTGISGMPDWVACDDARDYCLLGYNGGDHVLVQIDEFEVVGTIADWYPNPREALLILGMTEEVADQILGT